MMSQAFFLRALHGLSPVIPIDIVGFFKKKTVMIFYFTYEKTET